MSPVLPIHVESWVIGDHGDPPRVGRTEQYTLGFVERPVEDSDPDDPLVHEWAVVAAPQADGVLLHGDGWTAHWRAPHPVAAGPVRVRGYLFWNWPDDRWPGARLRGRVERVQVLRRAVDTSEPDRRRWSVVPGSGRLRDVAEVPRLLDVGLPMPTPDGSPVPNPWWADDGVVVTLDPDRAAALMPGAVAADGDALWVADRDRSIVLRLRRPRDPRPEVTAFRWDTPPHPGPADRRLHADPAGCWVTDSTGVRRLTDAHGVRLVDDVPVGGLAYGNGGHPRVAAAGDDGTLAVILAAATPGDPRDRLRRYRPTGEVVDDVVLPTIARTVVADGDGFLLQWLAASAHPAGDDIQGEWIRVHGDRSLEERIGRVDVDGTVTTDPRHESRAVLIGPDPPVHYTSSSRTLRTLRGVRPTRTTVDLNGHLPASPHSDTSVWTRAGRLFVAGQLEFSHPLDPDGPAWPFAGRPDPGEDAAYWFAELDVVTLEPIRTATLRRVPRHLDVAGDGTVWMQADALQSSRVHYLPLDHPPGRPAPWLAVAGHGSAGTV